MTTMKVTMSTVRMTGATAAAAAASGRTTRMRTTRCAPTCGKRANGYGVMTTTTGVGARPGAGSGVGTVVVSNTRVMTRMRASSSSSESDSGAVTTTSGDANYGRLLLIFVAAAYGSLSVTLKLVFESAGAPTAGVLGGVRGVMTMLCFLPMLLKKNSTGGPGYKTGRGFWFSAAELAFWNFGNQGLCNVALLFTDATRVSFFTQASIAFTPFIASLGGDKVSSATWLGCALAFCGVAVLGMDGGTAAAAAELSGGFNIGDLCALAGAASYSMYVYRIGQFAKQGFSGEGLQVWKNTFLALMYGSWALFDVFSFTSGAAGAAVPWAGWQNWKVWALIAFSAIVPGCVADLTQAKGQETVSASETSVLLAGEPLFAAIFAAVTLGELLGTMGYVGGALIIFGALVAGDVFTKEKTA